MAVTFALYPGRANGIHRFWRRERDAPSPSCRSPRCRRTTAQRSRSASRDRTSASGVRTSSRRGHSPSGRRPFRPCRCRATRRPCLVPATGRQGVVFPQVERYFRLQVLRAGRTRGFKEAWARSGRPSVDDAWDPVVLRGTRRGGIAARSSVEPRPAKPERSIGPPTTRIAHDILVVDHRPFRGVPAADRVATRGVPRAARPWRRIFVPGRARR